MKSNPNYALTLIDQDLDVAFLQFRYYMSYHKRDYFVQKNNPLYYSD